MLTMENWVNWLQITIHAAGCLRALRYRWKICIRPPIQLCVSACNRKQVDRVRGPTLQRDMTSHFSRCHLSHHSRMSHKELARNADLSHPALAFWCSNIPGLTAPSSQPIEKAQMPQPVVGDRAVAKSPTRPHALHVGAQTQFHHPRSPSRQPPPPVPPSRLLSSTAPTGSPTPPSWPLASLRWRCTACSREKRAGRPHPRPLHHSHHPHTSTPFPALAPGGCFPMALW